MRLFVTWTANRLAAEGEGLVTYRFRTGRWGTSAFSLCQGSSVELLLNHSFRPFNGYYR